MNNKDKVKLAQLKTREIRILARGKYLDFPGALRKVQRQIKALEKTC